MWQDEVLDEIYRVREEHAKTFNYNLQAICDDLRQKQVASGWQMIAQPLKEPPQHRSEVSANLGG